MKSLLRLAAFIAVAAFGHVSANSDALTPQELWSDNDLDNFQVSPTGEYIVYLTKTDNTHIVTIAKLKDMSPIHQFQMGENKYVARIMWANDERLLIYPGMKYGRQEGIFATGRLQAINFDGSKNVKLYGFRTDITNVKRASYRDYFYIESMLRDDPEHILITTFESEGATRFLRKLDIYKGRMTQVERSSARKASFAINKAGEPVAQLGVLPSFENQLLYKDKNNNWVEFPNANDYELISGYKDDSILLRFNAPDNVTEIHEFNRITGETNVLASHKDSTLGTLMDNERNVIGYTTNIDKLKYHYFDLNSKEAAFHELLNRSFKGLFARVSSQSRDGKLSVVHVSGDKEPSAFYLFNHDKKKLSFLHKVKESIDRSRLSTMRPINFEARDGLKINGYLTTPNDFSYPGPLVLLVHGGPFGPRDSWGFDREAQYLASNGYAVLQVNFRGSGGYGKGFEKKGYRQWGLTMQDDLTDATQWAIDNQIADKNRICIYGASYGGYASLMGVVKEPDLYQCAVGYVGVYDLTIMDEYGDIQQRQEGMSFVKKQIGDNNEVLKKASPNYHVDKIKAALFLVHGEDDVRAHFKHYEVMTEALDKAGYPYESMVRNGEGHGFVSNENNYEFYERLKSFFDKHIGKKRVKTLALDN